jgi:hypothetical protein
VAFYSGDGKNNPVASNCGDENVTVNPASPRITTTDSPTSELIGTTALTDKATLSGGDDPTGTITFYLFGPSQGCTATPTVGSYTFSASVSANGDGTYGPVTGPIPSTTGTWEWVAVYVGNGNNNSADSGCGTEAVSVTAPASVGLTQGFWHNQNGHALLDPDRNGDIDYGGNDHTYTIGLTTPGDRYANVSTLAQSDKILPPSNACGSLVSFNLACSNLPGGLHLNTLNALASQTLAAEYNNAYITGFSGQTLGSIGCTIPASLQAAPYGLKPSSSMAAVIAAANLLIGQAIKGGSTSQTTAGDMVGLLGGCVNMQ